MARCDKSKWTNGRQWRKRAEQAKEMKLKGKIIWRHVSIWWRVTHCKCGMVKHETELWILSYLIAWNSISIFSSCLCCCCYLRFRVTSSSSAATTSWPIFDFGLFSSHFATAFQYLHLLLRTAHSAIKRQSSNFIFYILSCAEYFSLSSSWYHKQLHKENSQ